jgi:hypothetical protein
MSDTSHLKMHQEHDAWRNEDNLWREELAIWQGEIDQALKDLPCVEKTLRAHSEILQQYAASIRLHEQDFANHEHALAQYERGDTPEGLVAQAQEHGRESERHVMQRRAHEKIKKQQHNLLTKWNRLFAAVVAKPPKTARKLTDH